MGGGSGGARRTLALIVAISALAATPSALAEDAVADRPRRARLVLPDCPSLPFQPADLLATLRVELLATGTEVEQGASPSAAPDELVLIRVDAPSCDGADIRVRVEHLESERSARVDLDLGDRPAAERGRVLALAIAELLRAWLTEPPLPYPRAPVTAPETPATEPPRAMTPTTTPAVDDEALRRGAVRATLATLTRRQREALGQLRRPRLEIAPTARAYPVVQGGLFGGRVGVSFQLTAMVPLRLGLDAGYAFGGGSTGRGDVVVQAALGGLSLLYEGGSDVVRGALGSRLELGYGWVEGHPTVEGVASASFGGFLLAVEVVGGLRIRLGGRVLLLVDVVAGYVPVSLEPRVEGRAVGGIGRALLGLDVGISVTL